MDLWDIVKTTARRWYVVVPTLALAGVVAVLMTTGRAPTYEVTGSVILVAPGQDPTLAPLTGQPNPYLAFTGSLETTANAVVAVLQGPQVRSGLAAAGVTTQYEVEVDRDAPIITVTAQADAPDRATGAVERLLAVAGESLIELQDSVAAPTETRISASVLVAPTPARVEEGNLMRLVVTVAGLGVAAAVSLALLVDALVGRSGRGVQRVGSSRRRRRAARSEDRRQSEGAPSRSHGQLPEESSASAMNGGAPVPFPAPTSRPDIRALYKRWAGASDEELFAAPLANSPSRRRSVVTQASNGQRHAGLEDDLREIQRMLEDPDRSPAKPEKQKKQGRTSARRR